MTRRKLTKTERHDIYQKTNGHCAYCGCALPFNKMTVDHVLPIATYPSKDELGNMLPACRSCNHYKSTLTLEHFREAVERFPIVLMRDSVTYKNAVRFGIVIPNPHKVKFYFEKQGERESK